MAAIIDRWKETLTLLWQHQGLRKYGQNTIWLFAEKAVRILIGFTVGIYVARQLGPEQYGLLNYAISYVSIFAVIAGLGFDSIMVRELVRYPEKIGILLGTAFLLKLGGFLLMLAGIGVGLWFFHNDAATNWLIWLIAAGYLFQSFQVIDFYFQAEVKSKYVAISQIAVLLICSGLRFYLAWNRMPLIYFATVESLFIILSALGYAGFYLFNGSHIKKWGFSWLEGKILLRNSFPLLLSGIAGMIYMRGDQIFIKNMLGAEETGYYSVAVRLVELWYFLPMAICSSLFPAVVKAKSISPLLYESRIRRLLGLMFWLGTATAAGMSIIGYFIISKLYGPSYMAAYPILLIYTWKTVFCNLGVGGSCYYISENLQTYSLVFALIGAGINLITNYIFIRWLGVTGCAWASLLTSMVVVIICPLCWAATRMAGKMTLASVYRWS